MRRWYPLLHHQKGGRGLLIFTCKEHDKDVVVVADIQHDLPCPVCQEPMISEPLTIELAKKTFYEIDNERL